MSYPTQLSSLSSPQAQQPTGKPDRAGPNAPRILIIRPTALGDVSRTVPVLVTLRQAMPDAQIHWLVNESFADVVRHHVDLDQVVIFPRKRFGTAWRNPSAAAQLWTWSSSLGRGGYDLVFDLQGLFRSGLFTLLTAAPTRVGFSNARELGWLGYNRRHKIDSKLHTVDRMLALVEAEGYSPHRDTSLYVGSKDQQWLDHWRSAHGITGSYTCLAPTARWPCKCWPIEHYTQIALRLLEKGQARDHLVILASPHEQAQTRSLIQALQDHQPRVITAQTTVGQLMAILSQTQLLVCNDSAPLHIAVGFNRPIVAIFGPTDPALVGPYRRQDSVVCPPDGAATGSINYYRHHRLDQSLIATITVDTVWEKIQQQLS